MVRALSVLVVVFVGILAGGTARADVGDEVAVITVPVPSSSGLGIGIAVDCNGNLYYTNSFEGNLYRIDDAGNLEATLPILDQATGAPVSIGAIAWDETRQKIWGGTDNVPGIVVQVWLIDPMTGLAEYRFDSIHSVGIAFCDGIGYDEEDDSVWVSDDVDPVIDHIDADTGADLGPLIPLDATGDVLGTISGVMVGTNNTLYLGRNGFGEIIRVDKTTGAFIDVFSSPGGRDEDLECDAVNFPGIQVVWSKDAFNNTITAIEVESGTCACGGATNNRPRFVESAQCDQVLSLTAGVPFSHIVIAVDLDTTDTVLLTATGVPAGATHTPPLPASGNPVTTTFAWTPGNGDVGTHVVTYTASDGQESVDCTITLEVSECHLAIARGSGSDSFDVGGHVFPTQLGNISRTYPVTMADRPMFPLPRSFDWSPKTPWSRPLEPELRFSAQVVMYNPLMFPNDAEQWTAGLEVSIWPGGEVTAQPFGDPHGMTLAVEVVTDEDGQRYLTFPFTIDGL